MISLNRRATRPSSATMLACAALLLLSSTALSQISDPNGETIIRSLPVPPLPKSLPPRADNQNCAEQARVEEQNGIASITFENPCRAGKLMKIEADGLFYQAQFDGGGRWHRDIPLLQANTEVKWPQENGATRSEILNFPKFANSVTIALVWRQAVDLTLQVVGPQGPLLALSDQSSHATASADQVAAIEGSRLVADANAETHAVTLALPPERNPQHGILSFSVGFLSRGTNPQLPYCGEGPMAAPQFDVVVLRYGQTRRFRGGFTAQPCGKKLDEKAIFQRIGDLPLSRS